MPETPDRKIEELLRAYAAKRREEIGAPLELHPAARRLLQAEVARLHPREAAPPATWWNSLAVLWPRLAFAAAVFVVLGICVWWLVPRGDQALEMARNDAPEQPLTAAKGLAENGQNMRPGELSRASAAADDLEADYKLYSRGAEVAGGTSRADLVAQLAPSASAQLKSSPLRQVADAPTLDGAGQAGLENLQLRRALTEQSRNYSVPAPTGWTAGALQLKVDTAALAEAARPVASGKPSTVSFGMAGAAPSQQSAEKADSFATDSTVFLDATLSGPPRSQTNLLAFGSTRFNGLQTNVLDGRYTAYNLSLASEPTQMPAGKAQRSLNQGGPTQAFFGAIYSPLLPEIRSRPSQARSEALSERISPGTTVSMKETAVYETKAGSATGGRASAPTQVAATAKPEPVAAPSSRIVGQKAAGATDLASGVRYHFVNAEWTAPERARTKMLAPMNALSSFDFERSGDRVSIADADGSVYEGSVVNEREAMPRESGDFLWMKQEAVGDESQGNLAAREAGKPEPLGRQVLVFRAAGTNRTLHQPVVMRGVIRYSGAASALGDAAQPRGRPAAPPAAGPTAGRNGTRTVSAGSEVSKLQLEGRLRIGTNESDFRAVRRVPEGK
jgi:hypothetical protein